MSLMNRLLFQDKKIKKEYEKIINDNYCISVIIETLMNENDEILIKDIVYTNNGFNIIIEVNNITITLGLDNKSYTTTLINPNLDYVIVYSNVYRKYYIPIGYKYTKNNKSVLRVYPDEVNPHKYKYQYKDNQNELIEYEINIKSEENIINDDKIINNLLSCNTQITRIRDILVLLNKLINLSNCEIKIVNTTDQGSSIISYYGTLTKYIEYIDKEDYLIKIYLESGQFIIDKTYHEKINDDIVPFLKKKGERNG